MCTLLTTWAREAKFSARLYTKKLGAVAHAYSPSDEEAEVSWSLEFVSYTA